MRVGRQLATVVAVLGIVAAPAYAVETTTVQRTIQDTDNDNLLDYAPGEDYTFIQGDSSNPAPNGYQRPNTASILNFLQLSDFQTVDEESPGRVEFLDTTQRGPFVNPFAAAYRPQESLSPQIVEAMVRQARNTNSQITGQPLQLTVDTGDSADSQQFNETRWFIDILDGSHTVDPNSGIPTPACPATPGTLYNGPRGGGKFGYYNPDGSDDGDGYSPDRQANIANTPGRDVTVRDFPELFDAAQMRFRSIGLDMPWYSVFGNHDALVQGNDPHAYSGPGSPTPNEVSNPGYQAFVTGCEKPGTLPPGLATPFPPTQDQVIAAFKNFFTNPSQATADTTQPLHVPPDPRRCYVAKDELHGGGAPPPCDSGGWIQQHFDTTGTPVGHGFAPSLASDCATEVKPEELAACEGALTPAERQAGYGRPHEAVLNHDGYYSFSPRTGLRFLVLDSITDECGTFFCSEGSIDDDQYRWVKRELDAATAEGQYVVLFSHHTERTMRSPTVDPTEPDPTVHFGEKIDRRSTPPQPVSSNEQPTLEDLLCKYTNVIAHVDGHEHNNAVIHHRCSRETREPDPTLGLGDYWEVNTAAHIDWPQQSRMIEFFHQPDTTLAMGLTILDHNGPANPGAPKPGELVAQGNAGQQVDRLASIGRELSYNDYQAGPKSGSDARGGKNDRNVIIDMKRPFPCDKPCQPTLSP